MFIYDVADYSPYKAFTAAEDLTGSFRAVVLEKEGLKMATKGTIPIGLITDESKSGEDTNVLLSGGGVWTLGEPCDLGELLAVGEGGKAFKATEGDFIFARALESGAADEGIRVQLIFAGAK